MNPFNLMNQQDIGLLNGFQQSDFDWGSDSTTNINIFENMIEDLPIISINVKILKFWSFILVHNYRRYISLAPAILLNISQFLDMYYSTEAIDAIIRNTYFLVLWFNTIVRAIVLTLQHKKYEAFMENLEVMYIEIQKNGDAEMNQILNQATKDARILARFNLFLGALVSVGFSLYPFFTNERVLPFGTTIPGVNKYESPYYECLFVFQTVITPMGCCMYIPFTSLIVTFIMFGIVLEKVLQHRLKNLYMPGDTESILKAKVIWCAKYHKKIIIYVDRMNDLVTYLSLLEFITFGATLCALLFLLNIVKALGQLLIVSAYIVMIITQIFAIYWYANELFVQSLNIAEAAYENPWFKYCRPTQKALLLITMRARIPLAVMVGNIYPMTLEMFQSLLNATYSYFNLMRRLYG